MAAYTFGYGDEIQTGACVVFLMVNGVVYEHVSYPFVLIAECFMISEILLIKVLVNLM